MIKKNWPSFVTIILSCILLFFSTTLSFITIDVLIEHQQVLAIGKQFISKNINNKFMQSFAFDFLSTLKVQGSSQLYHAKHSLFGMAKKLWLDGYQFLAFLILTFSTVVPVIKMILLSIYAFVPKKMLLTMNSYLSKWSMSDVFAVAVMIALLALNSFSKNAGITIKLDLHYGFYWFIFYCFFSIIASNFLIKHLVK